MTVIHKILGYLGLIPFLALSSLAIYGWSYANTLLISYSLLIVTFLAGILWSMTLKYHLSSWLAIFSNMVMLASWGLMLISDMHGIYYAISILFILVYLVETFTLKDLYPEGFYTLRSQLTLIAVLSLLNAQIFS